MTRHAGQMWWCALAALGILVSASVRAQDQPAKSKGKDDKPKAAAKESSKETDDKKKDDKAEEDPYAVPKDASADDLLKFIKGLGPRRVRSLEEMKKKLGAL